MQQKLLFISLLIVKWSKICGIVCDWLDPAINLESKINARLILFGDTSSIIISLILIISKYYIFLCRIRQQVPNLAGIKQMVKSEFLIEQQIAKKNQQAFKAFELKWKDVVGLVRPEVV